MKKKYILNSSINTARFSRLIAKGVDLFLILMLATLLYPFGLVLGLFYIAIADSMYGGQSIGKRAMGFSVISLEDGKPCTPKQSFIRNLPIIVPLAFAIMPPWGIIISTILFFPLVLLEVYLLFKLDSGHRLGDVMADTTVIGNDPNRVDLRKAQESWFDNTENGVAQLTNPFTSLATYRKLCLH